MDILKSSQLVIFSHSTIFITFSYRSLAGFSSNSYEVRGDENRKWRWSFAFDRCVGKTQFEVRKYRTSGWIAHAYRAFWSAAPSENKHGEFRQFLVAVRRTRCKFRIKSNWKRECYAQRETNADPKDCYGGEKRCPGRAANRFRQIVSLPTYEISWILVSNLLPVICIVFEQPIKTAPRTDLSRVARFVKPTCAVRNEDSKYEIAKKSRSRFSCQQHVASLKLLDVAETCYKWTKMWSL